MGGTIRIDRHDAVEVWTLDLPELRNPISSREMIDAFERRVHAVNADGTVRAVIITGEGTVFSSGGNIRDMANRSGMFSGTPHQLMDGYRRGIQRIPRALLSCDVPLIAAINGPAIGAGTDLALMCDLRIASTNASFAESFVKLGLVAGDGGSWLLPRIIGPARAAELALTGDRIDAATALDWGLVSRVVEPATLLADALLLAGRIAANPPLAVRMTKRLLREAMSQSLDQSLELAAALQSIAHTTSDHESALRAASERRLGSYAAE